MVERKESKRPPPVERISQIRKLILISLYNIIIAEIFNFVKFSFLYFSKKIFSSQLSIYYIENLFIFQIFTLLFRFFF